MKYIIVLGDGMADYHSGPLGNATPLELAHKPNIDFLAAQSVAGLIKTIPEGMKPASDVANLSVLGYDPKSCYTGRSPLEALSMGIHMSDTDIALRTNLVTLSDDEKLEDKVMLDYSAGEISTEEAAQLMEELQKQLGSERFAFYAGVSYRHCLIDHNGSLDTVFTPPHDISGKKISEYLPEGENGAVFLEMIKKSMGILRNHPLNRKRIAAGKAPASSIWFWGAGTKPDLTPFFDKYKLKGAVISAVDLLKGIAVGAGMKIYNVEGATGNIDTNFKGKAQAVIQALDDGCDFVYLHIEAPDECGHRGESANKILAIEKIDEVVGYIYNTLTERKEDFVLAVLPDHATPLCVKTHVSDPVPYFVYRSGKHSNGIPKYTEKGAEGGLFLNNGCELIALMIKRGNYDRIDKRRTKTKISKFLQGQRTRRHRVGVIDTRQ